MTGARLAHLRMVEPLSTAAAVTQTVAPSCLHRIVLCSYGMSANADRTQLEREAASPGSAATAAEGAQAGKGAQKDTSPGAELPAELERGSSRPGEHGHEDGAAGPAVGGKKESPYRGSRSSARTQALQSQRCSATNRHGEPCRARAIERGLCAMHSGKTDPREMGRAGGLKRPETELRKAVKADDGLRDLARETLEQALKGAPVDKLRLDAARSLFSYRAQQAPSDYELREPEKRASKGVTGLGDVILLACRLHTLSQVYGVLPELEEQLAAALATGDLPEPAHRDEAA